RYLLAKTVAKQANALYLSHLMLMLKSKNSLTKSTRKTASKAATHQDALSHVCCMGEGILMWRRKTLDISANGDTDHVNRLRETINARATVPRSRNSPWAINYRWILMPVWIYIVLSSSLNVSR